MARRNITRDEFSQAKKSSKEQRASEEVRKMVWVTQTGICVSGKPPRFGGHPVCRNTTQLTPKLPGSYLQIGHV